MQVKNAKLDQKTERPFRILQKKELYFYRLVKVETFKNN